MQVRLCRTNLQIVLSNTEYYPRHKT